MSVRDWKLVGLLCAGFVCFIPFVVGMYKVFCIFALLE